ncbi:PPK2 family polyphosphate kinase [Pseudonocardia lacus]|uniref:PPK2 family polyphosphate kinase n=1 Tax=Pseudonocardia lacus TaxID=2835865 RepID=UPI001BDD09B9|nr:PPK2 family polyphosphate kinase [Pseudonocardia lacus]
MKPSAREAFRLTPDGPAAVDPRDRPIGPRDKASAAGELAGLGERIDALQDALHAEAAGGGTRAVLVVLQGMDTSGKGGVVEHVGGLVNPAWLRVASFGRPTEEELSHDFLWRVRRQLPPPGRLGFFDRSHYEDVLVVRVDSLVPEDVWRPRYEQITAFEAELGRNGVTVLKCMLHISPDEQRERLLARLDDPQKVWKYNPGDVDARAKWPAYQEAYAEALQRTDSDAAPWYVIPADRKWYRNWAVASLLAETLTELDPKFPPAKVDVEAERARIETTRPV